MRFLKNAPLTVNDGEFMRYPQVKKRGLTAIGAAVAAALIAGSGVGVGAADAADASAARPRL
jgi:F0F1-type ATP synthase membrane subunit c/vacuolar-type H+-ATPase subunit K